MMKILRYSAFGIAVIAILDIVGFFLLGYIGPQLIAFIAHGM